MLWHNILGADLEVEPSCPFRGGTTRKRQKVKENKYSTRRFVGVELKNLLQRSARIIGE